ncbi:MAG: nucleotidyltransferase family protein [Burkholderiaceae bacterium]|nr:nucleotidyltransferase family protein [Burkholderiaceae bacterium]
MFIGLRRDEGLCKLSEQCLQITWYHAKSRVMNRETIITLLSDNRDMLAERFGARHLSIFGSAARDDMHAGSDVDVLVEFDGPATYDGYFDLKECLEQLLSRPVDLVTSKGLKPRARLHVERDLIRVT